MTMVLALGLISKGPCCRRALTSRHGRANATASSHALSGKAHARASCTKLESTAVSGFTLGCSRVYSRLFLM